MASPARPTISAAIADVLNAHSALPAAEIAEYITAGGREIGKRTISHSLQALKKQGRVKIRGGKWMLLKAAMPHRKTVDGYPVVIWKDDARAYAAVSNIDPAELDAFVAAFRQAAAKERGQTGATESEK